MGDLENLIFDHDKVIGCTVTRIEFGFWLLLALLLCLHRHLPTMGNNRSAFEGMRGPSYAQNINNGKVIEYEEEGETGFEKLVKEGLGCQQTKEVVMDAAEIRQARLKAMEERKKNR